MLVRYIEDVKNVLELRSLKNGELIHRFDLAPGSISSISIEDKDDTEFFFNLQNHLSPSMVYHCKVVPTVSCKVYRNAQDFSCKVVINVGNNVSVFFVKGHQGSPLSKYRFEPVPRGASVLSQQRWNQDSNVSSAQKGTLIIQNLLDLQANDNERLKKNIF